MNNGQMNKTPSITAYSKHFIEKTATWIVILFPLLILAGKSPSEIGIAALATFFIAYIAITKDYGFLKEKWVIALTTLWLYFMLRSLFTPNIKHAISKALPFVRFILFALCFEFLVSKNTKVNSIILTALYVTLAFLVLDGFIQFFFGHDLLGKPRLGDINSYLRLTGPFAKPILGTTIASLGIIVIASLIPLLKRSKQYFWLISFIGFLIYFIIFLAGERAALLRFIVSSILLLIGLFYKIKNSKAKKNIWIAAIVMMLITCIIIKISVAFNIGNLDRQIRSPIREITNSSRSAYLFLWKTGMNAGFSNILFGVGLNHFEFFCNAHPNEISNFCTASGSKFFHPHNIWIEIFAESGLIGIILFSWFCYELIKKFMAFYIRANLFESSLLIGILLAAFQRFLPLPSSGFFKNWYAIPTWFAIGWMLYIIKRKRI